MADEQTLVVEKRSRLGSAECRRLRRQGVVPGNLYGHEVEAQAIAAPEDAVKALIAAARKVLYVRVDGATQTAMLREVQWDTFGVRIQHFDLLRINPDERVEVEVTVELRGTAPGSLAGGIVEQPLRTLTVDCLAFEIPDTIVVRIGALQMGDAVHVRDLELPPGVKALDPPDGVVVHVVFPTGVEEDLVPAAGPLEPELIGRKEEKQVEE